MAQINVPFELEPWCEGCVKFEPEVSPWFCSLRPVQLNRSCKYLRTCRVAVAAAQRLSEQGGDADG